MIIGYHIAFGAYGFWLPNDPRGSWSTEVWAEHLRPFGEATKVSTRESLAHRKHDDAGRLQAKRQLKFPAVCFSGVQARAVGRGFARIVEQLELDVYACAIMPDHVHLATGRHSKDAEHLAGFFKRAGTRRLNAEGLNPLESHRRANGRSASPWTEGGWCVFINTPDHMRQAIRYVEANPVRAGLPRQRWPFVVPFAP